MKGICPIMTGRIVKKFALDILEAIDNTSKRC